MRVSIFRMTVLAGIATLSTLFSVPCTAATTADDAPNALRQVAYAFERQQAWLDAAAAWQRLLAVQSDDAEAYRHRVLALSRIGAAYLAQRLAQQRPALFSSDERYGLAHAAAAMTVSFGVAQQFSQNGAQRFGTLDLALSEQTQINQEFGQRAPTRFDELLALRERNQMSAAIALYQTLENEHIALPPYVKVAAAEAYLVLQQPQRARDLLLPLAQPENVAHGDVTTDAGIALGYALLESGQPDAALVLIDQLLAVTPAQSHRGLAGIEAANPDYLRVAVQAALFRLYSQRIDEVEQRLRALQGRAPFNSDVRLAWASLQNAREHRHAALEEYRLMLVDHPDSVDAAVGSGEALLATNATGAAQITLARLQKLDLDQRSVQRFAAAMQRRRRPSLHGELLIGRGAVAAGAESVFDASVRSAPLDWSEHTDLQVFSHWSRASGSLRDSIAADGSNIASLMRNRLGLGLTATTPDLSAQVELNHAAGTAARSGVVLSLQSSGSDEWQLSTVYDSNLNNLAAAAFRAGITAQQWQAAISWRANEARKAGLEIVATDFSDNNRRRAERVWWTERWHSNAALQIESTFSLATARNRTLATPYFNPAAEREIALATRVEHISWQHYQRSVRDRLVLQVGRYRQSGFGNSTAADLHYEREWQFDDVFGLTAGIGRGFHSYDGVREQRRYGYLNLNWILQ